MKLKAGEKVRHKLTGQDMLVLEVGPKSKRINLGLGKGFAEQQYLVAGTVRVRLPNMTVVDMYDYEIEGIEPGPETGGKLLLMDGKN